MTVVTLHEYDKGQMERTMAKISAERALDNYNTAVTYYKKYASEYRKAIKDTDINKTLMEKLRTPRGYYDKTFVKGYNEAVEHEIILGKNVTQIYYDIVKWKYALGLIGISVPTVRQTTVRDIRR